MVKKIELGFPEIDTNVKATLLEDEEPELCDALWKNLENPVNLICRHSVSTGDEFGAAERPPKHAVRTGTQAVPLGRKKSLFSRIEPGSISYAISGGYGGITVVYGLCTEPMPARGAIVAKVDKADKNNLVKGGKYVWNSQYITHRLAKMTVKRSME